MEKIAKGILRKMRSRLERPVAYKIRLGDTEAAVNPLLGKQLKLEFSGSINCVHCGRKTSKSFNQGFCWPCFQKLAQCDSCIIHPEKCHFDQGTCREPSWGESFCLQDHIIYLANSSGLKVGITRSTQVPTRWVDQGACQALAIIRVRNRLQSGALEVMFKAHVADKTNWRDMLKGVPESLDLQRESAKLIQSCAEEIEGLESRFGFFAISILAGLDTELIEYPVLEYPHKVTSFNFDKTPLIEGTLMGIKGQYLIFDTGVINLRRFSGYEIQLSY